MRNISARPKPAGYMNSAYLLLMTLAGVLKKLADKVKLSAFRKHPRGPKKPRPKRKSCKNKPHVSTIKILAQRTK